MKDESSQKMEWRKTAIVTVLISATLIAGMPLVVQAPEPTQGIVSVFGNVTYVNGMDVPVGWTVHLQNLDKDMPGEWDPTSNWWGTTGDPGAVPYSYMVTGDTGGMGDTATFRVNVSDTIGVYKGESANFTGTPFVDSFEDITVYPVGDDTDPKTNVTKPPEITDPIPSGTMLNWTEEDVTLTFNRTDPAPAAGVNYTNLSASEAITNVNVSGWITDIPQIGTGNLTIPLNATFGPKFNVTISNECNATIYYYSVDKNMTANVEDVKSLTVRIDKTKPVITLATATPDVLVVGITNTVLSVTATDLSGVANVTVNLSAIGGQAAQKLTYNTGAGAWQYTTNATIAARLVNLPVNVTDKAGNSNTTQNITLTVNPVMRNVSLTAPANKSTPINANATYNIDVTNTGNVADTFNLSINNIDNAKWANLRYGDTTIGPGENITISNLAAADTATVQLSVGNETTGTFNVSVYAESLNDSSANDIVTVMTTVTEAVVAVPEFSPVGLIALIGLLTVVLASSVKRKGKK